MPKNIADPVHVDPLVSVLAEKVLSVALNFLPIDDKGASSDNKNGADSEEEVGPEKNLAYVLKRFML